MSVFGQEPIRDEYKHPDGSVTIWVTHPSEVKRLGTALVRLTADQYVRYKKWRAGEDLIQNLLHDLDPGKREAILTGIDIEALDEAKKLLEEKRKCIP